MSDNPKPKFKVVGNGVIQTKTSDLLKSEKVKAHLEKVSKLRRK